MYSKIAQNVTNSILLTWPHYLISSPKHSHAILTFYQFFILFLLYLSPEWKPVLFEQIVFWARLRSIGCYIVGFTHQCGSMIQSLMLYCLLKWYGFENKTKMRFKPDIGSTHDASSLLCELMVNYTRIWI